MTAKQSRYLLFTLTVTPGRATQVWEVTSLQHGFLLGSVRWYGPWRQYVFSPAGGTVFNTGCLDEIAAHVRGLNVRHQQQVRERRERNVKV